MESQADKGKEVVATDKGLKRLRKGTKGSKSSATKEPHARRFGKRCLALEFPTIRVTVRELGLGYMFAEPEECHLTL
ncbi:hypothetical protein HAX54_046757, partial [Datura stramonium]|nr:hypothetical protein [Datura stramonium]